MISGYIGSSYFSVYTYAEMIVSMSSSPTPPDPSSSVSYWYSKFSTAYPGSRYMITYKENGGAITSRYVSSIMFSTGKSIYSAADDIDDVAYYVAFGSSYFETNIPYINWCRIDSHTSYSYSLSSEYKYYRPSNTKQYFAGGNDGYGSAYHIKSVYFPECSYMSPHHMQNLVDLEHASFPKLEFVPTYGFARCYKLESIELPACTSIYSYAFSSCSALYAITLRKQCYLEDSTAFEGTNLNFVYVPSSLVNWFMNNWTGYGQMIRSIPT